jgi:hypothetical protein
MMATVPEAKRTYVVVGDWLSRGAQQAQGGHALAEACLSWPQRANEWRSGGNVIIVLEADPLTLALIRNDIEDDVGPGGELPPAGAAFYEPDFRGELTAVCLLPGDWNPGWEAEADLLEGLPLAAAKKRWPWDEWFLQRRETKLRGSAPGEMSP